jgi:glyoxylase-like metal-dependent hydrolase (beta-lactamase superfamily II)
MRELLPGVWHWTAPHPNLGGAHVSSYWLEESGVLIDPLLPPDGIEWFESRTNAPSAIVLANRHHYRDSGRLHERYGVDVHVPAAGMHQFTHGEPVVPYRAGDQLPGGLIAVSVGGLSPDDSGLYLASASALWLADTIVRAPEDPGDPIGWVVDSLMDDPPETKRELLAAFRRILDEIAFENLMLAHGLPLIGDGHLALEELVGAGGRTAERAFDF